MPRALALGMGGAVFLALGGWPAGAQTEGTGAALSARAIAAYRELDYDEAASLFRRALATTGPHGLTDGARASASVYLGASELFRGRRDEALTAFRRALAWDPRHRADSLIFPPEVTDVFESVRSLTLYVQIRAPDDTTIVPGEQLFPMRLHASTPHAVTVDVTSEDGRIARRLYSGPIAESVDVRWEGLDTAGGEPLEGRLAVRVTSRSSSGRVRILRVPLVAQVLRQDTLPHPLPPPAPADSLVRRGRESHGPALRALAAGVLTGLTAVALPAGIAQDGGGSSARYVVGGTLSVAGVVGFLALRPSRSARGNAAGTPVARNAWRRQVEAVRAENERRRRGKGLRITIGRESVIEQDEP
jgi:hypothetical protein